MADLLQLADEMRFTKKFEKVSLGQGQGPKAEKLLQVRVPSAPHDSVSVSVLDGLLAVNL